MKPRLLVVMLASTMLLGTSAGAQQPDQATKAAVRALAAEGDALWDKADYTGALDRFKRAVSLISAPTLRVREAECLEKVGKWVEASDVYRQVARIRLDSSAPDPFHKAVARSAQLARELETKLPKILLVLQDKELAGLKIELDGKDVPPALWGVEYPVNPGIHEVVTSRGARRTTEQFEAIEGQVSSLSISLPKDDSPAAVTLPNTTKGPPPSGAPVVWPRTVGWIGIGVGGAGLALGAIVGGSAMAKKSSLEDSGDCSGTKCSDSSRDDVDTYNAMRTVSTVGFAVGAVGLGAGLLVLLATPPGKAAKGHAGVYPWAGMGTAGVRGRF